MTRVEDDENFLLIHLFSILVTKRAKSACEILDDASLVAYYSFDSGSVEDRGPNYLIGTATSNVTVVVGHLNEALAFGSPNAYFIADNFVELGKGNKAFSFSMWIKPTSDAGGGTVLHVANGPNFSGGGWCLPFIGFDSDDRIILQIYYGDPVFLIGPKLPLNEWTHVVQTYSMEKGISLYVNGTFVRATGSTGYAASGTTNYILLGYYGSQGSGCEVGAIVPGVFHGAIDEFRAYSRELTPSDVCVLANQSL